MNLTKCTPGRQECRRSAMRHFAALALVSLLVNGAAAQTAEPQSENYQLPVSTFVFQRTNAASASYVLVSPTFDTLAGRSQSADTLLAEGFWPAAAEPDELVSGVPVIDIEDLSLLTIYHGQTNRFYLTATNLPGGATFSLRTNPATAGLFQGTLEFYPINASLAYFSYTPAATDLQPFNLQFIASGGGGNLMSEVGFIPYPILPDEEDLLVPGHALPEADGTDYMLKSEPTNGPVFFNGQNRLVRDIVISAKKVVIRDGHPNNLFLYNNNQDIRSLLIRAETVRIENSLTLPGTEVTLYAGQVENVGGATIQGSGSLYVNSQLHNWLSPSVARLLVSYAKDVYLYGYLDQTRQLLAVLQGQIHISPMFMDRTWPALEQQAELAQIDGEINTLQLQLAAHRDFFGNPAGYVPLLSFEALLSLYDADIEASLRTWWLTYWLNNYVHSLQDKQQALATTKTKLTGEVFNWSVELTNTQTRITELQARSLVLNSNLSWLGQRLRERQEELRQEAERAAAEERRRRRGNLWRQVAYSVGSIMEVVPVWQPVLGAIGTGLQFVAQFQSPVPVQGIPEVNGVLSAVQNPLFTQGIGQVQEVAVELANGVQSGDWSGLLLAIRDNVVPQAIRTIGDAWTLADARHADVLAQVQRAKALAPELNIAVTLDGVTMGLLDHISAKTTELRQVGQEIANAFTRLGELVESIKRDALAIDAINRDLSRGTAVLDHRTLTYIKDLEQRTIARLRLYHYLVARAYEYRLVQPYAGDLDVERIVQRMITIAEAGHQGGETLSQDEFENLRGVYDDILSEIVRNVVNYLGQNPRSARQVTYRLTPADLQQLNDNLWLRINLMEKGVLDLTREDVRIVALNLTAMGLVDLVHEPNSSMTVELVHSGMNKLRRGTQDLLFYSTNDIHWAATYDANTGQIFEDHTSPLSQSLLCFLLQRSGQDCTTNLSLFSAPAAWADLYLTKYSSWNIYPSDVVVTGLTVQCTTEFTSWNSHYGAVEVFPSTDEISPLFLFDQVDLRGRQHGIGRIYRSYPTNAVIHVTAPRAYGSWRFVKWAWGRTNTFFDSTLSMPVPRSGVSLQAVYANSDTDEDGLPDWFERWAVGTLDYGPMDDPTHTGTNLLVRYLNLDRPVIVDPVSAPGNQFRCVVYADPGSHHVVESAVMLEGSTGLSPWVPVQEILVSDDPATVVIGEESPTTVQNTNTAALPRLFYRVRTLTNQP